MLVIALKPLYLATKRMDEKGWTLYTGSTPLLPSGVMSLGGCKFVSTTLLHVLPSGAAGRCASMGKVCALKAAYRSPPP